jgi:hypothetical protein
MSSLLCTHHLDTKSIFYFRDRRKTITETTPPQKTGNGIGALPPAVDHPLARDSVQVRAFIGGCAVADVRDVYDVDVDVKRASWKQKSGREESFQKSRRTRQHKKYADDECGTESRATGGSGEKVAPRTKKVAQSKAQPVSFQI